MEKNSSHSWNLPYFILWIWGLHFALREINTCHLGTMLAFLTKWFIFYESSLKMYIHRNDKTCSHHNCLQFKSQTLLLTIRRIQFLIDSTNYRNQFEMCQLSSSMLVLLFHPILRSFCCVFVVSSELFLEFYHQKVVSCTMILQFKYLRARNKTDKHFMYY